MKVLIVKYKREPYYQGPALTWDNSEVNLGFVRGMNRLLRSTDDDVILLNDDVQPLDGCLERLAETARSDTNIGIVGAKLLWPNGQIYSTGMRYSHGLLVSGRSADNDQMTDLPGVDLACAFVKRALIKRIGYLDEWFFGGVDDVDYCMRTRNAGWRVVYDPTAVAVHHRVERGPNLWRDAQAAYYHLYAKHHLWKALVKSYGLNIVGILAGVKNKDLRWTTMKIRGLIPLTDKQLRGGP